MQITPYTKNAKKHPKKQIEQVAKSIKEFGMNQPIVVDKQGVIIVGHGRYEALKSLGMEVKPEYIKVVDLSEEKANAYRLADNKLNESEWDMNLVIEELKGLSPEMLDLTGFDKDLIIEADEKDDEVPEVPTEPQSVLGDLYELGSHRVLCGDSTKIDDVEKLMDGKKADMVFTDPPYNQNFSGGIDKEGNKSKKGKNETIQNDKMSDADYALFFNDFLTNTVSVLKGAFYICFYRLMMDIVLDSVNNSEAEWKSIIIWKKNRPALSPLDYHNNFEPILYGYKHHVFYGDKTQSDVWEFPRPYINDLHPTMKPVELIQKAILNSSKGEDIVLDAFLGSGSTLIASEKTGRICYGMELDPKYIDVIVQRYVDYTGNDKIKKNGNDIIWKKTQKTQ